MSGDRIRRIDVPTAWQPAGGASAYHDRDLDLLVITRSPGVAATYATSALHAACRAHQWNRMPLSHKRLGIGWENPAGEVWQMPLPDLVGQYDLTEALFCYWAYDDARALTRHTDALIDALPSIDEYVRGQDLHVRTRAGLHVRLWSYPYRGPIWAALQPCALDRSPVAVDDLLGVDDAVLDAVGVG